MKSSGQVIGALKDWVKPETNQKMDKYTAPSCGCNEVVLTSREVFLEDQLGSGNSFPGLLNGH